MKHLIYVLFACCLLACHKPSPNTLVIGTIAGPETELIETAKAVAQKKYGLTVQIVAFNDYNLPNEALQEGSLDANIYQHLPYLQAAIKAHGYQFEVIGKSFVYPVGIYSKKIKSMDELAEQSLIAIPNDPSNELRALELLAKAHLITLKKHPEGHLKDIKQNPKQLQFKEMDAAQLPRVLPDVAAAVINTTFALPAGLNPAKDALFTEDKHSPYANIMVIRTDSDKKKALLLFVRALNAQEVQAKATELFGPAAIPAWD